MVSNNLFAYCDNNPVNKADSNGNAAINVVLAACVAVPFLATFGGTVITAIGASLTVAANALIPLLRGFAMPYYRR